MTRNAYVIVKHFGTDAQQHELAAKINDHSRYIAKVQDSVVLVTIKLHELSAFFDAIQANDDLNWIEYTVRVDVD